LPHCELRIMYCPHCGRQLHYRDPYNQGWCFHCADIVRISPCKIPFWSLMAVFVLLWTLQVA